MATGRITKRSTEAVPVPSGAARNYLWDEQLKGFGVMVTPTGSRSYLVQYRIGGRGAPTRRYTIGKHGSPWTSEKAKERAVDILELVRKKIDPLEAERLRVAANESAKHDAARLAFSDYADSFIARHAEARSLRSVGDIRAVFRRDLKPYFRSKPISNIRRSDVQACLDIIGARSGSAANKAHKWMRKMLSVAVNRGDLAVSPMQGMSAPHQERARQRVLRGPELVHVWNATGDLVEPWTTFIRCLLLLGQRLREVAGMQWSEIDLTAGTWIIPAARTKNNRDHLVPLQPLVIRMIKALQSDESLREGPVFTTNGKTPINGFSKLKRQLDAKLEQRLTLAAVEAQVEIGPLDHWVFHDLRRSVGTGCQSLGFPIEHTEAVLNHVSGKRGGLAAIYQLHDYTVEKAAALNGWADHVQALLSADDDSNLTLLAAKKA